MSKNKVQFQIGYSLPELFHEYGTEEQCRQALFDWKWLTVLFVLSAVPLVFAA